MTSIISTSSSSAHPDLDWSQLKETVLMVNLAVAQIDHSMHEGNQSVNILAESFTILADIMSDIQNCLEHIPEGEIKEKLSASTDLATGKVSSAIIAFQFYDKLSQRLSHVSGDLAALNNLISDPTTLYSPPKWKELQEKIREKYTMDEERKMFDKVLSGVSIEQALEEFIQEMNNKGDENDIELF
ncbi:MAG: hypothetical protein QM479_01825 [Pseudomonadota bacterium]